MIYLIQMIGDNLKNCRLWTSQIFSLKTIKLTTQFWLRKIQQDKIAYYDLFSIDD